MTAAPPAGRHDPFAPWRGSCRSCHAAILWADTVDGKKMPVEEKPTALRGNVVLRIEENPPRLVAGVLTKGQIAGARADGQKLYESHFTSCPNADGHRRRNNRTRRWRSR